MINTELSLPPHFISQYTEKFNGLIKKIPVYTQEDFTLLTTILNEFQENGFLGQNLDISQRKEWNERVKKLSDAFDEAQNDLPNQKTQIKVIFYDCLQNRAREFNSFSDMKKLEYIQDQAKKREAIEEHLKTKKVIPKKRKLEIRPSPREIKKLCPSGMSINLFYQILDNLKEKGIDFPKIKKIDKAVFERIVRNYTVFYPQDVTYVNIQNILQLGMSFFDLVELETRIPNIVINHGRQIIDYVRNLGPFSFLMKLSTPRILSIYNKVFLLKQLVEKQINLSLLLGIDEDLNETRSPLHENLCWNIISVPNNFKNFLAYLEHAKGQENACFIKLCNLSLTDLRFVLQNPQYTEHISYLLSQDEEVSNIQTKILLLKEKGLDEQFLLGLEHQKFFKLLTHFKLIIILINHEIKIAKAIEISSKDLEKHKSFVESELENGKDIDTILRHLNRKRKGRA